MKKTVGNEKVENIANKIIKKYSKKGIVKEAEINKIANEADIADKAVLAELFAIIEDNGIIIEASLDCDDEDDCPAVDIVRQYYNDVSKFDLLTREEELELVERTRQGDKDARDKLINSNLRLVVSIAKRYMYAGEFLDLVQYGNIGLIHVVDKYEPRDNVKFATYASYWIRHYIIRSISDYEGKVRMPAYMKESVVHKIQAFIDNYSANHNGETPSDTLVCEELDIKPNTLRAYYDFGGNLQSLDKQVGKDDTGEIFTIGDYVQGPQNVEDEVCKPMLKECLINVLNEILPEREAQILILRYGLGSDDDKKRSLRSIGAEMGVSRELVRQLENKALTKLRTSKKAVESLQVWLAA